MTLFQNFIHKEVFKESGWFISFLSFFCVLFFIFQNINHRFWMHDFEVYYSAANSYIHGETVYGISYGLSSGFYKYSPFALLLFAPLSVLPFYVAKVLHFIVLSSLIIATIILSGKIISRNFFGETFEKKLNLKLILIFLPLIPNIYTELHLGNVNIILLFILIIGLQRLFSGKTIESGLLFALGILIKPHFIIFLPLLLLRKKFKCLFSTITGIVIGLIFPAVFTGMKYNKDLLKQWMVTMQIHNNSLIDGQNTLYSWVYRYAGRFVFTDTALCNKILAIIILSLISLAILWLIRFNIKKENSLNKVQDNMKRNFIFEFFILMAIVPNITVTDSEHFLFSIPLVVFIINFLFEKKENILYKIIGIICLVMYGMNMREIVGKDISGMLSTYGILGLANFLIIIFCVIIHIKQMNTMQNDNKIAV
jgi:hypothetical protein